jgi:hypothetical protein
MRLSPILTLARAMVAALAIMTSPAAAQTATGQISGTVRDASGAVMSGVKVVVSSQQTGLNREARTGSNGDFVVPLLPAGVYLVTAEQAGFRTAILSLTLDPTNANAAYELGEMDRTAGDFQSARQRFEQAVTHYPAFEQALIGLGRTLIALDRPAEALGPLQTALKSRAARPTVTVSVPSSLFGPMIWCSVPHVGAAIVTSREATRGSTSAWAGAQKSTRSRFDGRTESSNASERRPRTRSSGSLKAQAHRPGCQWLEGLDNEPLNRNGCPVAGRRDECRTSGRPGQAAAGRRSRSRSHAERE